MARWHETFPRRDWFDVRELAPGVHLVGEPGHVNSFLIQGSRSAILLDTGLGVGDIRAVARELTPKPVLVVNSHYHFDHSNGNHLFDEIAIHRAGAGLLAAEPAPGLAEAYMAYTQRLLAAWAPYREADDLYFHLVTADRLIRPLPAGFDPGAYQIVPTLPTRLLDEGDVLDLGDRRLRVMHTPGHSPDCICLLDAENGLLFGGDTVNTGPIYAQYEESDVAAFAASTARLAELRDGLRRVFVCHFMRLENEPALLPQIAEGFRQVLAGEAPLHPAVDCFEQPVREARFDEFSIFIAPEAAPPTIAEPEAPA